jgi:amino acid transporter
MIHIENFIYLMATVFYIIVYALLAIYLIYLLKDNIDRKREGYLEGRREIFKKKAKK